MNIGKALRRARSNYKPTYQSRKPDPGPPPNNPAEIETPKMCSNCGAIVFPRQKHGCGD